MDFAKFVSMINSQSIYFCRADLLGEPFEGSLPGQWNETDLRNDPEWIFRASTEYGGMPSRWRAARTWIYVSCWHRNDSESAAMWKLYSSTSDAIAIRVKLNILSKLLPCDYLVAPVQYVDYDSYRVEMEAEYSPILFKRNSFEHESANIQLLA